MDQSEKSIFRLQSLMQRYNYKRYRKLRYNLLINFLILILLFFIQKNLLKSLNWIYIIGIVIYILISFPIQIFKYNTQLPTKDYKVDLTKNNTNIYRYQIYISILMIAFANTLIIGKENIIFVIIFNIVNISLVIFNIYIYNWILKRLIRLKDKHSIIVKNIYFKLPKKHRKF